MREILKFMLTRSSVIAMAGRLPYVQDAYRKYLWPRYMNAMMGAYATYQEAEAVAQSSMGWDHPELALAVAGGGKPRPEPESGAPTVMPVLLTQTSAYAVLMWLSKVVKPGVHIVDLGGANGKSYWHYRHYFDWPEGARWTVVDRPALIQHGVKLAAQEGATGLSFQSDIDAVAECDVIISLGCLQYLPPQDLEKFYRLAGKCETLIINKMALIEGAQWWSVQNYGASVAPYWIANRAAFIESFEAIGLNLVDTWTVPELSLEIAFQPTRRVSKFMGFVMRRDGVNKQA